MTHEEFMATAKALLGRGWQTRLSEVTGVNGSTVRRWVSGDTPVSPTVIAFLRLMIERQEARGALTFERQEIGEAENVDAAPGGREFEKFSKKLVFPGVDYKKTLPAIHAMREDDIIALWLDDAPLDAISAPGSSLVLTRHPDPWHRDAYVAAAATKDHDATWVEFRGHYYTLIAFHGDGSVVHQIATHAGRTRTLWSTIADPGTIVREHLG